MPIAKNSCPGEEMGTVACHNILALDAQRRPGMSCWSCLPKPKMKEIRVNFIMKICATSLGPNDATFVICNDKPGSGYTVLTGKLASLMGKDLIRWAKVDQCRMGCLGSVIFGLAHCLPF